MERSRARVWRLLFASHTVEWESHHQRWSFPSCPGGSHARPDNTGWGKVFIWISTWDDLKVLGRLHQLTTSVFVPVLLVCLFRFLTVKNLSPTFSCVVWWITSTPERGELNRQNIMTSMAGSYWGRERKRWENFVAINFNNNTQHRRWVRPPENFSTFITQPKPQSSFLNAAGIT